MKKVKQYVILMKELDNLEEGYFCGTGKRACQYEFRTKNLSEADVVDKMYAKSFMLNAIDYGYPCKKIRVETEWNNDQTFTATKIIKKTIKEKKIFYKALEIAIAERNNDRYNKFNINWYINQAKQKIMEKHND